MSAATTMTQNLVELVPIGIDALNVFASVVAVALVIHSGSRLVFNAKYGEKDGSSELRKPLMYFVAGILLWNLGASATTLLQTIYGDSTTTQNLIGYTPSSNMTSEGTAMIKAMVMGLRLIGYFFLVSGLAALRHAGSPSQGGNSPFQTSLWRILGGVAAINIVATVNLISSFIGFGNVL
ncbi:hypothetical protein LJR168_003829 [Pseudoxanthomonas sp. LjRoot168]|uniref:hypothetical protein n=1 Tax=unclassified Pseudoxanthomonas TaxID=2645906 RepID=UPI003ECCA168